MNDITPLTKIKDLISPKQLSDSIMDMTLNDISKFDMLDFPNHMDDPTSEYMQIFYNICDNAHTLYIYLRDIGLSFNFYISKYMDIRNESTQNFDLDLFELAIHQYTEYIYTIGPMEFPINLINKALYGNITPYNMKMLYDDYLFYNTNHKDKMDGFLYIIDNFLDDDLKDIVDIIYKNRDGLQKISKYYHKDRKIHRIIRRNFGYIKYGYKTFTEMEKKKEEEIKKARMEEYNKANYFINMINTQLQDAEYLNQFSNDKSIIKLLVNNGYNTIEDLYIEDISNIKNIKGLGKKKLLQLNTNCRRYYKFTIPKDKYEASSNKSKIRWYKDTIKHYNK